jgi:hypothetical protein
MNKYLFFLFLFFSIYCLGLAQSVPTNNVISSNLEDNGSINQNANELTRDVKKEQPNINDIQINTLRNLLSEREEQLIDYTFN